MNAMNVRVMNELEILNAALAVGWVKFSYYKADGTKRVAIGTRNVALIEQVTGRKFEPRRTERYFSNCNAYFDLSRVDWRQFNTQRFIGLELDRLSNEQAATIAITLAYGFDDCNEELAVSAVCNLVSYTFAHAVFRVVKSEFCEVEFGNIDECDRVIAVVGKRVPNCKIAVKVATKRDHREELIAELQRIRKREEEILSELLYQY